MRVVFMGTPDFALPSLEALARSGHEVVGVFTQPDRPRDRKLRMCCCPVKLSAQDMCLPVYSFERVRAQAALDALRALKPDVLVTAAFGQILSRKNLEVAPMGCVNVHASLLPKYRGSAPIAWAIKNGEAMTGITTMLTDIGVDTGDILLQAELEIGPDETACELTARLSALGAQVLLDTLDGLERGTINPRPQDHDRATHYPMLTKTDGLIDWSLPARRVHDHVRAMDPWPGAFACLDGRMLRVWRTRIEADLHGAPGEVLVSSAKDGLVIAAGAGAVRVLELQASGGKRMDARDYLKGRALPAGLRMDAR